jgi:outer membrane biosynthesis protein TonB
VSLLQLNGVLKAIESALDLPGAEQDGHLIHTPNGPRVAHMSHLPVQAATPDQSALVEAASRADSGDVAGAVDLHTEDPHHDVDPHAVPAPNPEPEPHPEPHPEPQPAPAHSEDPAPRQEPQATPTAPAVKEGYENAHPAELTKEKYAYLNGLAAFAIGPGMFFLGVLVVTTFGLFVYAYKNDPRVFG